MSQKYDEYLTEHKANVRKAYLWLKDNLSGIVDEATWIDVDYLVTMAHDQSKNDVQEYNAYDKYFYGSRSYEVVENFNKAWLHHIHNNPHHWQYWVLINDDQEEGMKPLDMPSKYIIEMICDWWSFSWKSGDLKEIFNWYNKHEKYMVLSDSTRAQVEFILNSIANILERNNYKERYEEE